MKPVLRCAIYTRKSSEEGLDQHFNSLDAQRESCEAYIQSQKSHGWQLNPMSYEDGGFSGGNTDRPALQKLMADIKAGRVQIVVVYKVDRLSRSLADFGKLMELFDQYGASFVSVTQHFDTTTSMGRLTLNVLLSFAQFEREVTGERIRDKIAVSKQKGMWMGGNPPMGYVPHERSLIIDEPQAERIREIFRMYDEEGHVSRVADKIRALGWRTPFRMSRRGYECGNRIISHGHVRNILQNPVYRGFIRHKGKIYPGNHLPIIDEARWNAVQSKLKTLVQAHQTRRRLAMPALLKDLLYTADDQPFATRGIAYSHPGYGFYDAPDPIDKTAGIVNRLRRLHTNKIDQIVIDALVNYLKNCGPQGGESARLLIEGAAEDRSGLLKQLLERVRIHQDRIELVLQPLEKSKKTSEIPVINIPIRVRGKGLAIREVHEPKLVATERPLIPKVGELIYKSHEWFGRLRSGRCDSVQAIATEDKLTSTYVSQVICLAFLDPDIAIAFLRGQPPKEITSKKLLSMVPFPLDWSEQRLLLSKL